MKWSSELIQSGICLHILHQFSMNQSNRMNSFVTMNNMLWIHRWSIWCGFGMSQASSVSQRRLEAQMSKHRLSVTEGGKIDLRLWSWGIIVLSNLIHLFYWSVHELCKYPCITNFHCSHLKLSGIQLRLLCGRLWRCKDENKGERFPCLVQNLYIHPKVIW